MSAPPEDTAPEAVTQLLIDWQSGNKAALDLLTPLVYQESHRLADRYLRSERDMATLQPTALVHEAYLRLVSQKLPDWESRAHFFGVAALLMRQVLVDQVRKRKSAKRGSGAEKLSLDEIVSFAPARGRDLEVLDDALNSLALQDARKAKIIDLRFFGGISLDETALALDISMATVGREQRLAEAWLHRELSRIPPA